MQSIIVTGIVLLLIMFSLRRRLQARPVRPRSIITATAIVVGLSVVSLLSEINRLMDHPLAIMLAFPAFIIGLVIGILLIRLMRFWQDTTGVLWMKGGIIYLAFWLTTVILRLSVTYASGAFSTANPSFLSMQSSALTTLSIDLIVFSMGLWISRAIVLVLKYNVHEQEIHSLSS